MLAFQANKTLNGTHAMQAPFFKRSAYPNHGHSTHWLVSLMLSAALLALPSISYANEETTKEPPLLTSLYGHVGAQFSIDDRVDSQGGINQINGVDDWGAAFNIGALFSQPFEEPLSLYVEGTYLNPGDRHFTILGAGARYDWIEEQSAITPYASLGLGYLSMRWDDEPVSGFTAEAKSGSSGVVTGQAGLLWSLTESWGLDLRARYDVYDVTSTIVQANQVSQIEDRSALSLLVGVAYHFGQEKPDRDDDRDGVMNSVDQCPNTLLYVPVNEVGCPQPLFSIDLSFEFAKFQVTNLIDRPDFPVVRFLEKNPQYHVHITGHTDSTGPEEINQRLSEQRAQEAKNFLDERGIDPARITTDGKGQSEPIADNENKFGRKRNRRISVEFYIPETQSGE